jgi:hypothetical protein
MGFERSSLLPSCLFCPFSPISFIYFITETLILELERNNGQFPEMPQKMQSILTSWRPRLSFRLKRFAARNGGDDSVEVVSEDEDEENLAATTRGSKRSAVASRELNNDYIVDSAPPKRHSPRTKSPFQVHIYNAFDF